MLRWIRSILGRQKDTDLNSSQMSKNEWQNSPNSPNDSTVSKLVSDYSKGVTLTNEQKATIRTRFNTWEKDGREVDF